MFIVNLRESVVARSRFTEDRLAKAGAQGISQYVVLGAGLDIFAYRNPYSSSALQVFEVDHPATQQWKRQSLAEAHVAIPTNLSFAAMQLSKVEGGGRTRVRT